MTSGLTSRLIHTCNINRPIQDQRLNFKTGSKTFTAYKIVTGGTSCAEGIISYLSPLTSGSWAAGTAAGYMIVSGITGTFLPGESLADDGPIPGAAVLDTAIIETDELGTPIYTVLTSGCKKCRFFYKSTSGSQDQLQNQGETGKFILKVPMVFFDSDIEIREGDIIRTKEEGWAGKTYEVYNVAFITQFNSATIDHIEAQLQSLEKGAL